MKAFVLSSGGLDSTTAVAVAIKEYGVDNVATVSFIYGQRHYKELDSAQWVADYYDIPHYVITLAQTGIYESSRSAMLLQGEDVPEGPYSHQMQDGEVVSTYVPFRNGLMLSAAAALAMSKYPHEHDIILMLGNHMDDDKAAYPDCGLTFIRHMKDALSTGTYDRIRLVSPFVLMTKADVVAWGLSLDAPYELTWSCYEGGEEPCGKCATCIDRRKAFEENEAQDPALNKKYNKTVYKKA